ncbi:O-antigen ligase family protein [Alteriqipengyuania lutimaris]|nr:O-antigen ligase family protein [Alteriqipengyuania lutimaris]MBB3034371.1 O-antigen ligase [Alteriqipengyuania lutimaris]
MLQLVILLPLACLAAGFGLWRAWHADWSALRVPLWLLAAWAILTLLQLVPLPPDLWRSLAGREPMAAVADAIGDESWRPLSMVPWRTEHALWALSIPLAALFLFVAMRKSAVPVAIQVVIAVILASALLGIVQITLGPDSMLYVYAVTNRGAAVGLLANANHAAMLSAIGMIVIAATAALMPRSGPFWHMPVLGSGFFLLLTFQLINGSRAGLGLAVIALFASALIALLARSYAPARKGDRAERQGQQLPGGWKTALPLLGGGVAIAALFLSADRIAGVDELLMKQTFDDMRVEILPVLWDMAGTYLPWGSGMGSFEIVYQIHEPSSLLMPDYINQAHNDLLQIVIEGGLPALAIALLALHWLGWTILRLVRGGPRARILAIAGAGVVVSLIVGSAVDYPLRAPLFQFLAVWMIATFAVVSRSAIGRAGTPDQSFPPAAKGDKARRELEGIE